MKITFLGTNGWHDTNTVNTIVAMVWMICKLKFNKKAPIESAYDVCGRTNSFPAESFLYETLVVLKQIFRSVVKPLVGFCRSVV